MYLCSMMVPGNSIQYHMYKKNNKHLPISIDYEIDECSKKIMDFSYSESYIFFTSN